MTIVQLVRRLTQAAPTLLRVATLRLVNLVSRRMVTHESEAAVVVSLTTFGKRLASVDLTIESIATGSLRPRRMMLWLSEEDGRRPLPKPLQRLQRRGVEIRSCPDYRSHKKYYPYASSMQKHHIPLVTADDDVLYPREWLRELYASYQAAPDSVHAHRAKWILVGEDRAIAPYNDWPFANGDLVTPNTFPTGVGGVLYPSQLLDRLRDAGERFKEVAMDADDVWLHAATLRAGMIARQVSCRPSPVVGLPGTQGSALWQVNVSAGGNDSQVAASYGPAEVERLMTTSELQSSGVKPWASEITAEHAVI